MKVDVVTYINEDSIYVIRKAVPLKRRQVGTKVVR